VAGKPFAGNLIAVGQVLQAAVAPDRAEFGRCRLLLNLQLKAGPVPVPSEPRTAQLWLPEESSSWMICRRASITVGDSVCTTIPAPAGVEQAASRLRAFHFHHADATGTGGRRTFQVAQGRDIDTVAPGKSAHSAVRWATND
jgi:hypothetical protein